MSTVNLPVSRRRMSLRVLAVSVVVGLLGVGAAQPASADDAGQWWYDTYNVAQAHADGWTGKGVKIAVIGSQIDPTQSVLAGAKLTVDPNPVCEGGTVTTSEPSFTAQHDTTVTALLVGNGQGPSAIRGIVPDAEVTFIGYGLGDDNTASCTAIDKPPGPDTIDGAPQTFDGYGAALQRAIADGAQIVTTSTLFQTLGITDDDVVADAVARKIVLVSSTNNPGPDWLYGSPYKERGVVAVAAMDSNRQLPITDVGTTYVDDTTVVAAGEKVTTLGGDNTWDGSSIASGASIAAPLVAGMIAATAQKYPDATGNQLLQSLIRSTGGEEHEPSFNGTDGYGYGLASLSQMLRVDPSHYPDENPLLDKKLPYPTDEQFAAAEAALATPTPEPAATGEPASSFPGWLTGVLIAAGIVVMLLIAAAIITIILVTRSRRKHR